MNPIMILDGGMGRELHRRGAPFRQPEWSALSLIEAPDIVRETHLDFIRAGAEVITTNSYALVPFHIGSRFAAEGEKLAALAGRLAQQAVQQSSRNVSIAASLPPLFGSYRPDLFDAGQSPVIARPLIRGQAPYADIWLAETLSSLAEARFWHSQLPDDGKPLWLSFTLEDQHAHPAPLLRSGETVSQAAETAVALDAAALLFNCSHPEVMGDAVTQARRVLDQHGSKMRLGVYANAFEPGNETANAANEVLDAIRQDTDPPHYLQWAERWLAAGADTVGGCCGIGPEHIAVLAANLKPKTDCNTR
ncbi:MAG: homocysteine S-methyltransferase family protein [Neisseria sp.]|uniref:homocysteine S-methyltransferase family protein n=1 Tax=Neisseria sp. TaxID=192066 RepID=UPI0026DCE398|nr:homocysteine S-methyltransferase family protein [Neisseria sp.]MDO4248934.1 homocysteine S-methyltransferase family protein [Neisseria sp.]